MKIGLTKYNNRLYGTTREDEVKIQNLPDHKEMELETDLKRTTKQNSALHKYCELIAKELNEVTTFNFIGLKGDTMELMYTMTLVKETLFKPIMTALYDYDSTTKLKRSEIDKIVDVITKFTSEKFGFSIPFPSLESLK